MKELSDMTTEELVNYIAGRLIVSIGEGDFKGEVSLWVMTLQQLGYNNASKKRGKK